MRQQTSPEEQALEELSRLKKRPAPEKKKRTPWARYTAVVLLAAVCIGGAELTACRFFAPALYEELTEPARPPKRRDGFWRPQAGRASLRRSRREGLPPPWLPRPGKLPERPGRRSGAGWRRLPRRLPSRSSWAKQIPPWLSRRWRRPRKSWTP